MVNESHLFVINYYLVIPILLLPLRIFYRKRMKMAYLPYKGPRRSRVGIKIICQNADLRSNGNRDPETTENSDPGGGFELY